MEDKEYEDIWLLLRTRLDADTARLVWTHFLLRTCHTCNRLSRPYINLGPFSFCSRACHNHVG